MHTALASFVLLNVLLKNLWGVVWKLNEKKRVKLKKEPILIDWILRPRVENYLPICHQISDNEKGVFEISTIFT